MLTRGDHLDHPGAGAAGATAEPGPDAAREHRPSARLDEAVTSADALLYHAVSSGKDVPVAVRGPIIKLRAALDTDQAVGVEDENAFLDAYARLAAQVAPTTAATLRATGRSGAATPWWARLLHLGPVSEAQRFAWIFGLLALCLVTAVGVAEWTRTYIGTVAAMRKQFEVNKRDILSTNAAMESLEEQIRTLPDRLGSHEPQTFAVALEILTRQRNELNDRRWRLFNDNAQLLTSLDAGYRSLNRVLPFAGREEVPDLLGPVGNTVSTYLLPILYGALGTCAFILRSLYAQMLDRSFDPRRSGEFVVRLFLGMLSGVTVQWVFAKDGQAAPEGTTPLVLAFLAGYSVELLFSGMDRLLTAVTGRLRPAHPAPRPGRGAAAAAQATGDPAARPPELASSRRPAA